MGNSGSSGNGRPRNPHRPHHDHPPPMAAPPPPNQDISGNRYVFAAATTYPAQYPNPNAPQYYQYVAGYYPPPPPVPLPAPFDHHHRGEHHPNWVPQGGRGGAVRAMAPPPTPYVEHQKAVTIRNDVNLKKETLRVEPDESSPGKFLVAFTLDATVAGSITVVFFAKEEVECNLSTTKENLFSPITVHFKEGLGQKFRQPTGEGIDFSLFNEEELTNAGAEAYPLAIKAEAVPSDKMADGENQKEAATPNSQITQAVFEKKDNGEYQARVVKQILWVNGTRYELQEIYGIGNAVEGDFDGNDPGKECVICLSEPRDTTVLPCRHMCLCSECAKVLRFQTNRCPICRQPVERLLEIKVNRAGGEQPKEKDASC